MMRTVRDEARYLSSRLVASGVSQSNAWYMPSKAARAVCGPRIEAGGMILAARQKGSRVLKKIKTSQKTMSRTVLVGNRKEEKSLMGPFRAVSVQGSV